MTVNNPRTNNNLRCREFRSRVCSNLTSAAEAGFRDPLPLLRAEERDDEGETGET